MKLPHRHLSRYKGRLVYTFNVRVKQSGLARDLWSCERTFPVTSHTADDAVNLVRDIVAERVTYPTEIETLGPKGGVCHRFIGWESMIGAQMFAARDNQLRLL